LGEPKIDQTELALARDEGDALARAYAEPMRRAPRGTFADDLLKFARSQAKRVIRDAQEATVADEDVAQMKGRMSAWMKVIMRYDRDFRELWANREMDPKARGEIVAEMYRERLRQRVEIFGE